MIHHNRGFDRVVPVDFMNSDPFLWVVGGCPLDEELGYDSELFALFNPIFHPTRR